MKKITYPILFIVLFTLAIYVIFHSLKNIKTQAVTTFPKLTSVPTKTISPTPTPTVIPTDTQTSFTNVQLLKATYGPPLGFIPTEFTVKSGIPARLEVLATEDGIGCMGSLMVPDFSNQVEFFEKDKTSIIEFTPSTPGLYYITCGMGIPHANLIVK